jgi:hypothetical protein
MAGDVQTCNFNLRYSLHSMPTVCSFECRHELVAEERQDVKKLKSKAVRMEYFKKFQDLSE